MSDYFSDREFGARARIEQVMSPTVWAAIVATVQSLINSGAFGFRFPERCPDGPAVCGCDESALGAFVAGEMPGLAWPLQVTQEVEGDYLFHRLFAMITLLLRKGGLVMCAQHADGSGRYSYCQKSRIRSCNRMQTKRKQSAVAGQVVSARRSRVSARLSKYMKEGDAA